MVREKHITSDIGLDGFFDIPEEDVARLVPIPLNELGDVEEFASEEDAPRIRELLRNETEFNLANRGIVYISLLRDVAETERRSAKANLNMKYLYYLDGLLEYIYSIIKDVKD